MINDRIQYAAEVLMELGVRFNEKDSFTQLLKSKHPEESLRSAFIAAKTKMGVEEVVDTYLKMLRTQLDEKNHEVDGELEMLMAVLEDEDILTPAERAQASVGPTDISFSLKYLPVLELIERIWPPNYADKPAGLFLWKSVLEGGKGPHTAQRLAKRIPPMSVDLTDVAQWVRSVPALEVFVSGLTPEAIAQYVQEIHRDTVEKDARFRDEARDATMIVLLKHHVRHAGTGDGWAAKFFEEVLEGRSRWHDAAERALPQFAQVAKAIGRLDDPRFVKVMLSDGLDHLDTFQLADLLVAGMPASLELPDEKDEDDRMVHLLEHRNLDFVSVLAPHMSEQGKRHFVREKLVWKLGDIGKNWGKGDPPRYCLDRNLLTELHDAGFDLRQCFNKSKGEDVWLHRHGHVDGYDGRFIFVALHALGVYPKDLRYSGMSPLHFAAFHDDVDAIRVLVESGYEVDNLSDASRVSQLDGGKAGDHLCTPLVIAAKHGSRRAFATLLELGADTGVKSGSGATLMQLLRDEEMKRMLKSARTASSVRKGMSGYDGAEQAPARDTGGMSPL